MRDYLREWSPALDRDMEVLRFGDRGLPLLVFPTSQGRFYQWEDFGMVEGLRDKIDGGFIQLWCVDSYDSESWYARHLPPAERVRRHLDYERYVTEELIPGMPERPVAAGTSWGAFHAFLFALRRPHAVGGFVCISGAFDSARFTDGDLSGEAYFTNPLAFLPGLSDEAYLRPIRGMKKKVIASGEQDQNVEEAVRAAKLLIDKGVDVTLDLWPGWAHDWPYWTEMLRAYV